MKWNTDEEVHISVPKKYNNSDVGQPYKTCSYRLHINVPSFSVVPSLPWTSWSIVLACGQRGHGQRMAGCGGQLGGEWLRPHSHGDSGRYWQGVVTHRLKGFWGGGDNHEDMKWAKNRTMYPENVKKLETFNSVLARPPYTARCISTSF